MTFYLTEEYLRLKNIAPEDVQIEFIEENVPNSGFHEGWRMHLPEAPEVTILIDPNFSRAPQHQFVCSMRNPLGIHENNT